MEEMALKALNTNLTLRIQFYETLSAEAGLMASQEGIFSALMRKSWLEIATKILVRSTFSLCFFERVLFPLSILSPDG
jgi:hypothetical protein